jgi:hypothetical protein
MSEKTGYKPTSGMQAAARRALKLKADGKANGAGTSVGWARANQLANGETLSLSTVKRMYSFFSRHEVDKQGKDWNNAENPSNGKIMWLAWGGDAGFSWSRKITQREKNMKKSVELNEFVEEIKDILDDVVNPITEVIEIEDDLAKSIDPKPEDLDKAKDKYDGVIEPRKGEPADKELYSRIISEAKRKFDVYPSAYANGWVVQEYKRRGGTYKVSKDIFEGSFDPYALVKRKFSAESRRRMADAGNAMPDGSYPIGNKDDLMNAIRSWGRGGSDPKVKAHIKRRAKELGAEDMIPDNWK